MDGHAGRARTPSVLRTPQPQAEFLKSAEQMSTILPSWAPYVDSTSPGEDGVAASAA